MNMKKRICAVLTVCLAMTTVIFCVLWLTERGSRDDVRALAQSGALEAYNCFSQYNITGEEADYWQGVAAFRSFEQAYKLLSEGTNKETNYLVCNAVYGSLVIAPEKSREHISEILETMEILSKNVEDENGYAHMINLRNAITV